MSESNRQIIQSFKKLKEYCEKEDYRGWDPYDGLNSKVFKAIPLIGRSAIIRLIWIQLFKRSPLNLRAPLMVPKMHNAKGIGLFLQGYCNLYHAVDADPALAAEIGSKADIAGRITYLADMLLQMQAKGFSGAAWGYNFPWQCRREFLFPANEPTVVATNFCATALMEAYEITKEQKYLDCALSAADFVLKDLRRTQHEGGFLFSYSLMPGNDTIYNASLLGSRLLAYCYKYTGDERYLHEAKASVLACCASQQPDGSWTYGVKPVTGWKDSFHTGYNLDALIAYQELSGDSTYAENIERGLKYYVENFFLADGTPKYYNDRQYPIDIHCPGQLAVTLSRLHRYDEYKGLIYKVMAWTIENMQAPQGYFYYQKKRTISSHISYMRWSNAFMFAAMSYMLLEQSRRKD